MVERDGFVEVEVGVFFKITALSSSDSWSQIFCPSGDTSQICPSIRPEFFPVPSASDRT